VIVGSGSKTRKCSLHTVEFAEIAPRTIAPVSLSVWHKADSIDSISIVKTTYLNSSLLMGELSSKLYLQKGVALRVALQGQLKYAPLFHTCCAVFNSHSLPNAFSMVLHAFVLM
jgi:hypothetical protein